MKGLPEMPDACGRPVAGGRHGGFLGAVSEIFGIPSRAGAARFYLFAVTPMLLALNLVFVPLHAPDDFDHLKRAYTLAHGSLWPMTPPGQSSGGMIDSALSQMIERQKPAILDWPRTGPLRQPLGLTPADRSQMRWSGETTYSEFPGAASYMPLLYAPQAAAIWAGERYGLTLEQTVLLARLANGATAATFITAALASFPLGAASILLLLLLPKTLVQFASNSADPVLHAATLCIVAFCVRSAVDGWVPRTRHFLLVAAGLFIIVGARPPLLALTPVPLWVAWRSRNMAAAASLLAAAVLAVSWFGAVMPSITDLRCGPTEPLASKMLAFLRQGPVLIARSVWWHKTYYYKSFVGELGWGNGPAGKLDEIPMWIYAAAIPLIGCAVALDCGKGLRLPAVLRSVMLLCSLGMAVATFAAMYGVCTVPGSLAIGGVQGRYFVAPALLAIPALAGLLRPAPLLERCYLPALFLFLAAGYGVLLSEGLRIYWMR